MRENYLNLIHDELLGKFMISSSTYLRFFLMTLVALFFVFPQKAKAMDNSVLLPKEKSTLTEPLADIFKHLSGEKIAIATIGSIPLTFDTRLNIAEDLEVNNNIGCWTDNFNDQVGTVVANTSNLDFNVLAGTVSLATGQVSGVQQSVVIAPPSFDSWLSICLAANYSGGNDLTIDVLDASTDTIISGYMEIPISSLAGGCYDISGLDINTYPELKIQINHIRGNTAPVVNQLQVKWNPRTFLLFDKVAPTSILAGQEFRYLVRVSANFVDAKDIVIYDPLPSTINGTVIYETGENYGQSDDPTIGQISDGGQYTATSITVNGVAIPAHAVYWTFDELKAGVSNVFQFFVSAPNGTLDGTIWENTAEVFTSNGDNQSAPSVQTVILSTPAPEVIKEEKTNKNPVGNKIYPLGDTNYIIGADTITFQLQSKNTYTAEGRERMYNTVMWDNLSDLVDNGLIVGTPFNISGGGVFTATATIVNGINIPENSIYWNYGTFNPGAIANESFQVALIANPTVQTYTNYVYLDSDQTDEVSDKMAVEPTNTGLPSGGCSGNKIGYFSTYPSGEQDKNSSVDGSVPINFGDPLQYRYGFSNCGGGELEEIVLYDMVPEETQFIGASFDDPTGLLTGTVYYYEDLTATYTDALIPPPFDWTNPTSTGWTTTKPIDNNSAGQIIWVAWHVDGLTSPYRNADPTRPNSVKTTLDVIPLGNDPCVSVLIENVALAHVYQFAPSGGGAVQVSPDNNSPLFSSSDEDLTLAQGSIGQFEFTLNNAQSNGTLFAPDDYTFSIDVCNSDANASAPFIDTDVEFKYGGVMVNGQTMYPDFVESSGGVVTNFDPANGSITLNTGPMLSGACATVSITLFVPAGIVDLDNITIQAIATGKDPYCDPITASTQKVIPVSATPIIQVYKEDVLDVISSGDSIYYNLNYRNIGDAPSTNTWVVDRIPFLTSFVEAYAPNGEEVWFTNQLPPNMPANQISVIYPVDFSTISSNFSLGILNDNGTPADYSDDVWTSPFGNQTTWIAFKVDDPTLTPNQLPVDINFKTTSFLVENDDDGSGPNTTGSPEGTVIFNEEVIFSDQNLMAVGNEVRTTIEDFPGLELDKRSSSEIVTNGETFDWIVDYRNNSSFKNDIVTITDIIPSEFTLNTVSHEWNAEAGGGGVTNISADPNVTITNNADGSTTVELRIAGSAAFRSELFKEEGGTIYFNVQAKPEVPCGALIFNQVSGYASNGGGASLVSDEDPITIYNPDVYLGKSVSNAKPQNGDTLTYTLNIANRSIIEAQGVIIRDTLPAGFNYINGSTFLLSGTTTIGEPTISGNVLEWNDITVGANPTGTLPANYSNTYITYEVEVIGVEGQSYTNFAAISTTSPEKTDAPNRDSAIVTIPFPDPTIQKTGPLISTAGGSVTWTLTYLNKNNSDASDVYIIESLPDANGNGADVTFINTIANGPNTVTPYYTATAGTAPAFDSNNPIAGSWSATSTSPVNHIAYLVGTLPAKAGPYEIQVTASLLDGLDGSSPAAGTQFVNRVEIFTSSTDDDPTNNINQMVTRTPGVDLGITKVGSKEGVSPGIRPGDEITYEITVSNRGSIDAYGIRVADMLPSNFIPDVTNFDDFTSVEITDGSGGILTMLDLNGDPVTFSVPVTEIGTPAAGATVTWYLGTTNSAGDADYYRNLAIPVGGQVRFTIKGTIDSNASDGDIVSNETQVVYEGLPANMTPEEFLINNVDSSQVAIWRPDVTIKKSVVNDSDGSEVWTETGEIMTYTLEYNNIGNADADAVCIQEIIPEGTNFVDGSLTLPPGASVTYTPNESDPTSFEVCLPVLPAPPNYDSESAPYSGTPSLSLPFYAGDPTAIACTDKLFVFESDFTPNAFSCSIDGEFVRAGDIDNDGDLDIISFERDTIFSPWINDGTGMFTQMSPHPFAGKIDYSRIIVFEIDFADVDLDGNADIFISGGVRTGAYASYQNAYLFFGDGTGYFAESTSNQLNYGAFNNSQADFQDYDNDGDLDLALVSGRYNTPGLTIYLGDGAGGFADQGDLNVGGDGAGNWIQSVDFDGDGDLDIFSGHYNINAYYFENDGSGTFTFQFKTTDPSRGQICFVRDFNKDGHFDIFSSRDGLLLGDGMGGFATAATTFRGDWPDQINAVDYDQDGDIDIVHANGNHLEYLENLGDGTFASVVQLAANNRPHHLVSGDFDGDGDMDVVSISQTTSIGLQLLKNTSDKPYLTDSYYETLVETNNITSWDKLLVDQMVEEGASIEYCLYDETADDDGDVTNNTPLWGPQRIENSFADISSISPTNSTLILRVKFTSDGTANACIQNWTAVYTGTALPKLEFKVQVDDVVQVGQTTVDNTVKITTTTPELDDSNNESKDSINIRLTDVAITKSVDKTAIQASGDETVTYTLNWEVLGPQSAINTVVYDVLPNNISYQSAIPTPTFTGTSATGQDSLVWILGAELNVGSTGSIIITSQETLAAIGDNLTNITWIENDRQETDYDNNADEALTIVGDYANVYIQKEGSSIVDINQTGDYQLNYSNNGNIAADNVIIRDTLPVGFMPTMTNNANCTITGQAIECTLGTISVGGTGIINIDFQVANDPNLIGQTLQNVAEIETTTPETDISDNEADHEIPVALLELASLSGTVWHDDNRDGIIDPTENRLDSVLVILTGTDIFGNNVTDTTYTDASGEYSYPGLNPGTYSVEEVQPSGWLTITTTGLDAVTDIGDVTDGTIAGTTQDVGAVNTINGNEAYIAIPLDGGDRGIEYNFGEDLGILGDTVWLDTNENGIQDMGEIGQSGITVRLYSLGLDMMIGGGDDALEATQVTNALGAYLFEDLLGGDYYIEFDINSFPYTSYYITTQDALGSTDEHDSDVDANTGRTPIINLANGAEDLSWDMGIFKDCTLSPFLICSITGNNTIDAFARDELYTAPAGMMTYNWLILSGDAMIDGASNTQTVVIDFGNTVSEIQLITTGTDCCIDTCSIMPTLLRYDFGDLPDNGSGTGSGNYETEAANGGPSHLIIDGLSIGSTLDNEVDGQPNATATGDEADEDGYSFPTTMAITAGRIINLPLDIVNTTGIPAHLEAWIDWNGNGEFDAEEMIADLTDDGAGDFGQYSIRCGTSARYRSPFPSKSNR